MVRWGCCASLNGPGSPLAESLQNIMKPADFRFFGTRNLLLPKVSRAKVHHAVQVRLLNALCTAYTLVGTVPLIHIHVNANRTRTTNNCIPTYTEVEIVGFLLNPRSKMSPFVSRACCVCYAQNRLQCRTSRPCWAPSGNVCRCAGACGPARPDLRLRRAGAGHQRRDHEDSPHQAPPGESLKYDTLKQQKRVVYYY